MIIENVDELVVRDVKTLSTVCNLVPEFSPVMSLLRLNPWTLYQAYKVISI